MAEQLDVVVRRADPTRDYERIAAIRSHHEGQTLTADLLRKWDGRIAPGEFIERVVALSCDRIVGCGGVGRNNASPAGLYHVGAQVDPEYAGRGVGRAIGEYVEALARARGGATLEGLCRANDERALRFAKANGYEIDHQIFEMRLDLPFDPEPFQFIVARVQQQGFRLFTFADTAQDESARRRLYDLFETTARDEPAGTWEATYEEFRASVLDAYWFDPKAFVLAEIDGQWVGLCSACEMIPGRIFATLTGVRREFRGRGIAQALKVLNATYASERGAEYISGTNHTENAAMIAVNRKLGYRQEPGWCFVRKSVC